MSDPKWNDDVARKAVKFERLLSAKPQIGPILHGSEPCLRDLIFARYREHFSEERADWFTKEYIAKLWEDFNA
jgi:hypothetical protein